MTTTTIMARLDRPRFPADVFNINDHVKCKNLRSKHYGHTARIIGMGTTRLHVEFDNAHAGKFIDWRDAELTGNRNDADTSSNDTNNTANDDDLSQLSQLLEHMAFTTATLISSEHGNSQRMEHLLTAFDRQVRVHADTMALARLSTTNTLPAARSHGNRVPPEES
jgi:hypothetical protein